MGYKEPQRSEAPREEVDDLIIGVRERVTRFVLCRVSEQLDVPIMGTRSLVDSSLGVWGCHVTIYRWLLFNVNIYTSWFFSNGIHI